MNEEIQFYRSMDGDHYFTFRLVQQPTHLDIYAIYHPGLNGQDPSPHKTHLFPDGRVCIVAGREPRDVPSALELAKAWAEYFIEYRRTGVEQH